jgi:hypothetical protein
LNYITLQPAITKRKLSQREFVHRHAQAKKSKIDVHVLNIISGAIKIADPIGVNLGSKQTVPAKVMVGATGQPFHAGNLPAEDTSACYAAYSS